MQEAISLSFRKNTSISSDNQAVPISMESGSSVMRTAEMCLLWRIQRIIIARHSGDTAAPPARIASDGRLAIGITQLDFFQARLRSKGRLKRNGRRLRSAL